MSLEVQCQERKGRPKIQGGLGPAARCKRSSPGRLPEKRSITKRSWWLRCNRQRPCLTFAWSHQNCLLQTYACLSWDWAFVKVFPPPLGTLLNGLLAVNQLQSVDVDTICPPIWPNTHTSSSTLLPSFAVPFHFDQKSQPKSIKGSQASFGLDCLQLC